jgi:hypothetical protein
VVSHRGKTEGTEEIPAALCLLPFRIAYEISIINTEPERNIYFETHCTKAVSIPAHVLDCMVIPLSAGTDVHLIQSRGGVLLGIGLLMQRISHSQREKGVRNYAVLFYFLSIIFCIKIQNPLSLC